MRILVFFMCLSFTLSAQDIPAFPGAEGYGADAIGGRGGAILFVTNLNDSGPGSLRAAVVASGPRIVIFKVGGIIQLESRLSIVNPYLTIAGQTAPGGGICIAGYSVLIYGPAHDIIIRGVRFRHGDLSDENGARADALGTNGVSAVNAVRNVIIDHCSMSWSIDETLQVWDYSENITVQWSMITESLDNAGHPDGGPHGYGAILKSRINDAGISFHHNLLAHHRSRNPKFTSDAGSMTRFDFRNNVVYNHGTRPALSGESNDTPEIQVNFVGNYFKYGPDTDNSKKDKLLFIQYQGTPLYYLQDNFIENYSAVTNDNWLGVEYWQTNLQEPDIRINTPFDTPPVITQPAAEAYEVVLDYAGAIAPVRDAVDVRIVANVRNRSGQHIDSQSEVGGWPIYASGSYPQDSDNDGMPDDWETANGLNPNNSGDANGDIDGDGYTNIEAYINSLIPLSPSFNSAPKVPSGLRIE